MATCMSLSETGSWRSVEWAFNIHVLFKFPPNLEVYRQQSQDLS